MREGGVPPRKFAARVPHADFVDIVDGKGGAPPQQRAPCSRRRIKCIFLRARVSTLSTNSAKPRLVRPSTARIVDDWRAVPIDIIDNRSSGRSSSAAPPRSSGALPGVSARRTAAPLPA